MLVFSYLSKGRVLWDVKQEGSTRVGMGLGEVLSMPIISDHSAPGSFQEMGILKIRTNFRDISASARLYIYTATSKKIRHFLFPPRSLQQRALTPSF